MDSSGPKGATRGKRSPGTGRKFVLNVENPSPGKRQTAVNEARPRSQFSGRCTAQGQWPETLADGLKRTAGSHPRKEISGHWPQVLAQCRESLAG